METSTSQISRRTVVKGAAWSVPVIAAAVAAPMAAASGDGNTVTNSDANYYWASESQSTWSSLDPAQGNLEVRYSTRIAFKQEPWTSGPPAGGVLQVTVVFSQDVTLKAPIGQNWLQSSPAGLGPARTFVFQLSPSGFGGDISINLNGTTPGAITASSTMSLINGGTTTWASESSDATAVLVS